MNRRGKNSNLKLISMIAVAITIIAGLLVGVAWAKFRSLKSGQAESQIAKWSFKLVDGKTETTDLIDFPITRTDTNTSVAEGVLAPRNIWRI